jgi:uncharacterized membrane protein
MERISWNEGQHSTKAQTIGRILLGAMLAIAGISHLTYLRRDFLAQVPPWLPMNPDIVVLLSELYLAGFIHRPSPRCGLS